MLTTITDDIENKKCQEKLCEILKEKLTFQDNYKFGDP